MSVLHQVVLPLVSEVKTLIEMMPLVTADDIGKPYLPDGSNGKATEGLEKGFKIVTGGLIIVFSFVAVVMTLVRLGQAAWSDRREIKDAAKPFAIFLILAMFGSILQVVYGVFNPVVTAMS